MATHDLNAVAAAMQVHPRTVLRRVTGEMNTYWGPGYNPDVSLSKVAEAYGVEEQVLQDALDYVDVILTPNEAADLVGRSVRALRRSPHLYPPAVKTAGVVRYSQNALLAATQDREE